VPLVVQVSRWDRRKDMTGVMVAFTELVAPHCDAQLLLAGPAVTGVADDPEGAQVFDECVAAWRALPHAMRGRVHLACLPMRDSEENAALVNALQRHAAVITQKSLAEGFGLTVVEAMWKRRPVVGSAVGGIADQLVDGETGLLVADPHDLDGFAAAVRRLLNDRVFAAECGRSAHERAHRLFLADRHLKQWGRLIRWLLGEPVQAEAAGDAGGLHTGGADGALGGAEPAHPAASSDAVVVPLHAR